MARERRGHGGEDARKEEEVARYNAVFSRCRSDDRYPSQSYYTAGGDGYVTVDTVGSNRRV